MLNSVWYWVMRAFFGSVRIRISMSSVREWNGTTTGNRPTNSGIIPNSTRSCASTRRSNASFSAWSSSEPCPMSLNERRSLSVAARLPCPSLGTSKPRYCNETKLHTYRWRECDHKVNNGTTMGTQQKNDVVHTSCEGRQSEKMKPMDTTRQKIYLDREALKKWTAVQDRKLVTGRIKV